MTASSPVQINIVPFKEWMNVIVTVAKQMHYFKDRMVAIRVVK